MPAGCKMQATNWSCTEHIYPQGPSLRNVMDGWYLPRDPDMVVKFANSLPREAAEGWFILQPFDVPYFVWCNLD